MSKEINEAFKNCIKKFGTLTQRSKQTGEYNFYVEHFRKNTDNIGDALAELVDDKTGYFEEFALDCMQEEVIELIRAICSAEVYIKYFAFYNPSAIFPTRDDYIADECKRAIEARKKQDEYYAELAQYYNNLM